MKNLFSIKKIIGYVLALSFLLMGYFIENMFWNTAGERNGLAGIHNLQLFFIVLGALGLITSLVHAWFTKRQGFILATLGVMMIMISMLVPLMELVAGNRYSCIQLLYTCFIVIIVLLVIVSLTENYRLWIKILLYMFIIFQIFQFYKNVEYIGNYASIAPVGFLFFGLGINILALTIIAPNDKL